ncbi:hypothetical protein BRADI_2g12412v3 [Brachypodium distachyon]|uniref:Uncharacterized protein n=1 Tax=Brachypodium distachyon TaxID=15368 RepID=A0A0Q3IE83_BRADI|nr:hypothetical protein BRADI_2g12412v3 [Brachypodium distachyon]
MHAEEAIFASGLHHLTWPKKPNKQTQIMGIKLTASTHCPRSHIAAVQSLSFVRDPLDPTGSSCIWAYVRLLARRRPTLVLRSRGKRMTTYATELRADGHGVSDDRTLELISLHPLMAAASYTATEHY